MGSPASGTHPPRLHRRRVDLLASCALFLGLLSAAEPASAFNLDVIGPNGETVDKFRWVLEEDATFAITPGAAGTQALSTTFHRSHMPVIAAGTEADLRQLRDEAIVDATKRYFLSVRPESGYTIGGASVAPASKTVTVQVNTLPIPTAQISILAFNDHQPLNNAFDTGEEPLPGLTVVLSEAGGRYGQSGGQVTQDAFGNPLGTTYSADGSVAQIGTGVIKTGADGKVTIKNLVPAKYGVEIVAPDGWVQTSTIEGTRTIDAWVKAGEPASWEGEPQQPHVVIGFVQPLVDTTVLSGGATLKGQVVNKHMSPLPDFVFHPGSPYEHTTCWIGLNDTQAGSGRAVYAQRCQDQGCFEIPNVPAGAYQLVVWDDYLDMIIDFSAVTVNADGTCNAGGSCDLGQLQVFNWFHRQEHTVFLDNDEDGFRDCFTTECNNAAAGDEIGLAEQAINLRWRDGTIYQSFPTDHMGYVPFDEVFPFFSWLVAEVDYLRYKATGVTVVVDAGGEVKPDQGWDYPSADKVNPQVQTAINDNTGNRYSRTETGPVLTQGFQGFMGQTSIFQWGKKPYSGNENGGITGIVHYATTRAEDDPRYAAAENWEPGIPHIQVALYEDKLGDGIVDDKDSDGVATLADVDNYPFGWRTGGAKGANDVDRNGNGTFDAGDAVQIVTTDSWDDSLPTGCPGTEFAPYGTPLDCYDGMRNWNQVRPAVFDGGYAFTGLEPGNYIVESAVPPGYVLVTEASKNVDFGDSYVPAPELLPPECAGDMHTVPDWLSFTRDEGERIASAYAGQSRPLCDRKKVRLNAGANAAADFFLYTEAPISAHIVGFILDDLHSESDIAKTQFGERYAPPFMPVSVRDFSGREIVRSYSNENGQYNLLVPSTYSVNVPSPSGVAPNMLDACINDPGPIASGSDDQIIDPYYNPQYGQFCFTFQYMPGATTYLDTPILPIAAYAGPSEAPLDCEFPDGTPVITSVTGPAKQGPYVNVSKKAERITLVSAGSVEVDNPLYGYIDGQPRKITRDYGFGGSRGTVTLNGVQLDIKSWKNTQIVAEVPKGAGSGQILVTKRTGVPSMTGITLTALQTGQAVHSVSPPRRSTDTPIQTAIDAAAPGDIIMLQPGTYSEQVILWKPVKLQGWGSHVTFLNAYKVPSESLTRWQDKVRALVAAGSVDLLPGQNAADPLSAEAGPGVTVLARQGEFTEARGALIDGITITGATLGGGIFVNGHADFLTISNNRLEGNQGTFNGGIRLGHPYLTVATDTGTAATDASNDSVTIRYNHILKNGSQDGAGGGVAICTGSDGYAVLGNFICGNFSMGDGGGIGHLGRSDDGRIEGNRILFNQVANQQLSASGGGIYVGGLAPLNGVTSLTEGSGSVVITGNRIQGNQAASGDGGGIRLERINGLDLTDDSPASFQVGIYNSMIVNNSAGLAGAGISLQDAVAVDIVNDTVANNDSLGTAADAFPAGSPNQSQSQPSGIVARAHGSALATAVGAGFSQPRLSNLIVLNNRAFSFLNTTGYSGLTPKPDAAAVNWDLGVLGTSGTLTPTNSIGQATNPTAYFVSPYYNGLDGHLAADEGGNAIDVRVKPLTATLSDYHLATGNEVGRAVQDAIADDVDDLADDYDAARRPTSGAVDAGADEFDNADHPQW